MLNISSRFDEHHMEMQEKVLEFMANSRLVALLRVSIGFTDSLLTKLAFFFLVDGFHATDSHLRLSTNALVEEFAAYRRFGWNGTCSLS